jgi:ATPase subunit of ABC transporter with duplicated ATPase domains
VFFISHDRTFVNLVATQIIEVQDGNVRKYPGNYEEYVWHLENVLRKELQEDQEPKPAKNAPAKPKIDYHARKEEAAQKRKLASRLKKCEERIAAYKKEHEDIHQEFLKDAFAWSRERNERFEELAKLIESAESEWLEITKLIEESAAT